MKMEMEMEMEMEMKIVNGNQIVNKNGNENCK